jgi:HPt (histidine-containing phosphotransfer) domain-containing protein
MVNTILDLPEFMERVQDDKELLLELLDIYVEDFGKKRKLLDEAAAKNDFEQVRNIAHSLKGASGNISAKDIRETFSTVEVMGKNSNLSGIEKYLAKMDAEFELLLVRIQEIKKEMAG